MGIDRTVLHISPWAGFGGTERHVQSLVRCLRHKYRLLIAMPEGPLYPVLLEEEAYPSGVRIPYPMGIFDLFRARREIEQAVRRESVDLVHVHASRELAFFAAGVAGGIPVIFTPHAYTSRADVLTASVLGASRAAKVICFSEWERDRLRRYGIPEKKLEVIPNGVRFPSDDETASMDPKYSFLDEDELGAKPVIIGCLARLLMDKGLDVLIKAFARLRSELSSGPFRLKLILVGDGPERMSLQTMARRLGVGDCVTFTGGLSDPFETLKWFDIFVLPSRREAFPLSICEAMAYAKPVVATAVGGVPELVRPGVTGLLVAPGDSAALAEAMGALVVDKDRRLSMGALSRKIAFDNYTDVKMSGQTMDLYEKLFLPVLSR